jgi:uncharacterized membrane protein
MAKTNQNSFVCPICEHTKPAREGRAAELVHGPVGELIRTQHPDWDSSHVICLSCLNRFRTEYVEQALETQRGELSATENTVIESLREHELLARNINPEFDQELTVGQQLADKVAAFGGSWRFIILFGAVLGLWILIKTVVLLQRPYDPYPFILLNLVLSCLAALQAPIIMMSQNRQEAKDRLRAEHDYQVNLKAEIEIRQLHIKLDQLMNHSWQRLLEIQQVQMELLEDMARLGERGGKKQ